MKVRSLLGLFILSVLTFNVSLAQNFLSTQTSNRMLFTKGGTFRFTIQEANVGSKSEYSLCFEVSDGLTRPAEPNTCRKNVTGNYTVKGVNKGNTLTIWTKDSNNAPGGEATLTSKVWLDPETNNKAELIWEGSGNFKVVVIVEQVQVDIP